MNRRSILMSILGLIAPIPLGTDKNELMRMFDQAGIDFQDPSTDHTPGAISIKVDGDTVIGIDGYTAVFKFEKGKLSKIGLWGTTSSNQEGA